MDASPLPSARVDVWLWAARLTPTRSAATELCRGGHVTVNGASVKPSSPVKLGDRIEARIAQRVRIVEVLQVLTKRVGAAVAATCFVDHSPPVEPSDGFARIPVFQRDRGTGRPTKADRRKLDRLRDQGRDRE